MGWTFKRMLVRLASLKMDSTTARVLAASGCLGLALQLGTGCAGNTEAMKGQIQELEDRLKDSERHNGRLSVRAEDLEDQVNLLVDRVETNRLAMERRGNARTLPLVVARPGGNMETGVSSPPAYNLPTYPVGRPPSLPSPQAVQLPDRVRIAVPRPDGTVAQNQYPQPQYQPQAQPQARVVQPQTQPTKVNEGEYERVTITEDDLRKIVEEDGGSIGSVRLPEDMPVANSGDSGSRRSNSSSSDSGSRSRSVPRPAASGGGGKSPVTDERLPVVPLNGGSGTPVAKAPVSNSPMDVYKGALSSYRTGEYSEAFNQFKAYLDMKPPRDYLDNAYYWLGESSFGLGQYEQAIEYFNRVIKQTPEGNKVPDAMLKASIAYKRLGQASEAKATLRNLIETYPSTNAAKLASDKLNASDSQ